MTGFSSLPLQSSGYLCPARSICGLIAGALLFVFPIEVEARVTAEGTLCFDRHSAELGPVQVEKLESIVSAGHGKGEPFAFMLLTVWPTASFEKELAQRQRELNLWRWIGASVRGTYSFHASTVVAGTGGQVCLPGQVQVDVVLAYR